MSSRINKCPKCNKYTLKSECDECKVTTLTTIPAKYSPEDPYGNYRREAKREDLKKKGLL